MKSKKKALAFITVAVLTVTAILCCVFLIPPQPQQIFKNCLPNIVELKAVSDEVGESYGTGEIMDRDGMIVTNAHVVTYTKLGFQYEFKKFYIRFSLENEYREARLIKYDSSLDIAVLQIIDIEGLKLRPITTGDSNSLTNGDRVYAIGNAVNYGISITQGIVSIPYIIIEYEDVQRGVIQCDLVINEGNSGGALLDCYGKLVGITTFRIKDKIGNVIYGLAYCIPINIVLEYIGTNLIL